MIKGFIFDLDGVITDTAEYHYIAWKELADQQGWKFDREVNERLRGVSRLDSIKIIAEHNGIEMSDERLSELANEKNELYVKSLGNITSEDYLPGAESLLSNLKERGFKIGLGSASKNARTVLDKLGASSYFDVIGDGSSVERSKPAPDLFLFVASEMGFDPSECVVYEDAESGVDAAKAGGLRSVGIGPEERVGHADIFFPDMESAGYAEIREFFDLN